MTNPIALLVGWVLDLIFREPQRLPHPIVWFGKAIAFCEHRMNKGNHRKIKGAVTAVGLIVSTFFAVWLLRCYLLHFPSYIIHVFDAILIFYCLAGTTLIREVREVFLALDRY